jgi:hypothetical protein
VTKQATFNKVARHLLRQGERATDDDNAHCVLHGNDGLRCAAGVLVTRKDYDPKWEMNSSVDADNPSELSNYLWSKGHDIGLVIDLQLVHDVDNEAFWPRALRRVAEEHSLSAAVIDVWEDEQ